MNENGVELRNVKVVSHNEAKLKSFKLTVSIKDMPTVLDAAFWPQGAMVRRYRLDGTWLDGTGNPMVHNG